MVIPVLLLSIHFLLAEVQCNCVIHMTIQSVVYLIEYRAIWHISL